MGKDNIKRHVVSYEKLSPEVLAAFNAKYPGGVNSCLDDIQMYPKPDGTNFYAVTIELPCDIYLVKIPIQVDDVEDIERWLESGPDMDDSQGGSDDTGDTTLPDDNISQYGSDDDSSEA